MTDVDRALFNSLKQRFDLGLFDPPAAYDWPGVDDVGNDAALNMSLLASQEALVLLRNDGTAAGSPLLPLPRGKRIAVVGPHANAQKVLVQPYPFAPFCPDNTLDCLISPATAIAALNAPDGHVGSNNNTASSPGCDLFNSSQAGFADALALAAAADYVVLLLGIETCGMDPAHNLNPLSPGRCFQERFTTEYAHAEADLMLVCTGSHRHVCSSLGGGGRAPSPLPEPRPCTPPRHSLYTWCTPPRHSLYTWCTTYRFAGGLLSVHILSPANTPNHKPQP